MSDPTAAFKAMFPETDWTSPAVLAGNEDFNLYEDMMELLLKNRKDASISQQKVAQFMETTQSAVSEIETLGSKPRIDTIQRYARAVGYKIVFEIVKVEDEATLESGEAR